jgi:iron complex transport system ATP-binding protein
LKDGQVYRHGDRSILDSTALQEVYGVDAKVVEIEGRHMVLVDE